MRILARFTLLPVGKAIASPVPGKQPGASAKFSLAGCINEHDGHYVPIRDTTLQPKANLRPEAGSPEENLARYAGQEVSVGGRRSNQERLPVMTFESLKPVSEARAPAGGQQK